MQPLQSTGAGQEHTSTDRSTAAQAGAQRHAPHLRPVRLVRPAALELKRHDGGGGAWGLVVLDQLVLLLLVLLLVLVLMLLLVLLLLLLLLVLVLLLLVPLVLLLLLLVVLLVHCLPLEARGPLWGSPHMGHAADSCASPCRPREGGGPRPACRSQGLKRQMGSMHTGPPTSSASRINALNLLSTCKVVVTHFIRDLSTKGREWGGPVYVASPNYRVSFLIDRTYCTYRAHTAYIFSCPFPWAHAPPPTFLLEAGCLTAHSPPQVIYHISEHP